MAAEAFDTIVIGAGQAGPAMAAKLATEGRKVALVESRELGGTCVNRGCTPTKTLRKSARVAHLARRAAEFGVEVGPVHINFEVAMQRMQTRVDESRAGLASWLGGLAGLTIVKEHGRLAGREGNDFLVEAGSRTLQAPMVMLNTGTRAFVPPIAGLADNPYLDNESLLKLRELPRKLVIIGGGYVSLEMGQIFRRLGSEVSIIEIGPRLTAREDEDVSAAIADMLRAEGIELHMGVAIERVLPGETEGGARVEMADGRIIAGSHLLVAVGRAPNTDDLGLKSVGLKTMSVAISSPTNGSRPRCLASGRWATSITAVPSPIPATTITTSWPKTSTAGSVARTRAQASTPCSPTRHWPTWDFTKPMRSAWWPTRVGASARPCMP